jgi:hypothetical protein
MLVRISNDSWDKLCESATRQFGFLYENNSLKSEFNVFVVVAPQQFENFAKQQFSLFMKRRGTILKPHQSVKLGSYECLVKG